jgi:hypothetical protein
MNSKIFISGHRDLTIDEFNVHYIPIINQYINWLDTHSPITGNKTLTFYIGDCEGCDEMSLNYIVNHINKNSTKNIYINLCKLNYKFDGQNENIPNNEFINIIDKFNTHEERDTYMTLNSLYDILWIRHGKWDSGTAQNFVKRHWLKNI